MDQLPYLQTRISSLKELRDLIHALRGLAAAHVQESVGSLPGIRKYVETVEDGIAQGALLLAESAIAEPVDEPMISSVMVVICSEQGFVGAFNEKLFEAAELARTPNQQLVIIGQRGVTLAKDNGLEVDKFFPMATHVSGVLAVTRQLAEYLSDYASAALVFAEYRRGGNFDTRHQVILPLDPALLSENDHRTPPLHHLHPELLLAQLAGEYLFAQVTRAFMESLASENAARLRVLENADQNIGKNLGTLARTENTLRQEAITSELLDVITGVEAIASSTA